MISLLAPIVSQPLVLLVIGIAIWGTSLSSGIYSRYQKWRESVAWQNHVVSLENQIAARDRWAEIQASLKEDDDVRYRSLLDQYERIKGNNGDDAVLLGPDDVRMLERLRDSAARREGRPGSTQLPTPRVRTR